MSDTRLDAIRDIIQIDINKRGLGADPVHNLLNACPRDFHDACVNLAQHSHAALLIVTGFFIPTGQPPAAETDGPLGAVFLARALHPLGIRVLIATDGFCTRAIHAGLDLSGLRKGVPVVTLPTVEQAGTMTISEYVQYVQDRTGVYTHLLALERVGPSHTTASLEEQGADQNTKRFFLETVMPEHHDRCHNMRGQDITSTVSPAQRLFESAPGDPTITTIGIGDGGNEIGMGKIPWDSLRRTIAHGGLIGCRILTRYLIVSGISNWGAYGLAAGIRRLRDAPADRELFNPDKEFDILEAMIDAGPLVDGVSGSPTASVDGVEFDRYAEVLKELSTLDNAGP
jgi:D-glutamate cyclase